MRALCIRKGVVLLIPMHLCVFTAERSVSFEKTLLINGGLLLIPATAFRFGADILKFLTPVYLASGGGLPMEADVAVCFALWIAVSVWALFSARRRWSAAGVIPEQAL